MSATCSIASAYSTFQAPALKNNAVSNSILITSERGNPWTTLIREERFGIASRPFGKDLVELCLQKFEFPAVALVFLSTSVFLLVLFL